MVAPWNCGPSSIWAAGDRSSHGRLPLAKRGVLSPICHPSVLIPRRASFSTPRRRDHSSSDAPLQQVGRLLPEFMDHVFVATASTADLVRGA